MIIRFQGSNGRPRLIAALRAQQCVHNDEDLAKELADLVELVQIEPGKPESTFIRQGATDNDIDYIALRRFQSHEAPPNGKEEEFKPFPIGFPSRMSRQRHSRK